MNPEARQSLPAADALGNTIRRKRASLFPPEPPHLAGPVIADPFDKTDGERDFLRLDDTAPDGTRVIVFATVESLGPPFTGIQTLYVNDATFASSVRQLCALSFLPSHRIRRGYEEIKPSFPAQAAALLKWFEKNYVVGKPRTLPNGLVVRAPPKFPPDLWSVHPLMNQGQPRGNNSVESWHACFLRK
ncbi:hypothetical protein ISCGN_030035 [Ixodes scapularis]